MTPAHQLELIERYPGLYRHAGDDPTQRAYPFARDAFSCGDGWFGIIDRLSAKLVEDPYLIVSQVKEKFGTLRVYFHAQDGAPTPDPELDARLDAEMAAALDESKRTCELCGQPGVYLTDRKWVAVRCTFCAALDDLEMTASKRAEATCEQLIEIRASMRRAMTKANRRARAVVFGAYEHVDLDLEIMIVVDRHDPGKLMEISKLRRCIDLDRGIALHVVTAAEFAELRDVSGTAHHEANARGIVLFDDLEEALGDRL
jgi:hypothetical protein